MFWHHVQMLQLITAKTAAYYTFYDVSPEMKVFVDTANKKISQALTIDGTHFALESDFSLWNGLMNYEQARKCAELFWKFYPYIYKRLANDGSPSIVRLRFGIDGVAYAYKDRVTVNQEHLDESGYSSDDYGTDGKAWNAIFEGTDAAGKTITQLWDMYAADDFSKCSAKSRSYGSKSQFIKTYNVREIVKARYN